MSDVIKVRGRIGAVRIGPGCSQHALPELAPDRPVARRVEAAPGAEGTVNQLPAANMDLLLQHEYARGRADGVREAAAGFQAEREARLEAEQALGETMRRSIDDQMQQLSARIERDAFKFALAVAGKIVKKEVAMNDEIVVHQIQEALRRVAGQESIKVRVNPRYESMVRQNKEMLISGSESVRELVVEADDKVEPGGCILDTVSGTVDARVFTQLEQIEAALFGQTV